MNICILISAFGIDRSSRVIPVIISVMFVFNEAILQLILQVLFSAESRYANP